MVERIKNKKGFTIIEVMVVIALIGILAAVLVPKFGGVRDTAKNTGMLTNAKMVEAYVASAIDSYKVSESENFANAIATHFSGDNALVNPYTGSTTDSISVDAIDEGGHQTSTGLAADGGRIFVYIDNDTLEVYINGLDAKGNAIKNTERKLTK